MKQSTNDPVLKTFKLSSLPFFAGVYSLKNTKNGFIYIGESKNIIQRLHAHRSMLERNKHFCKKMQNDANQDGIDIFEVEILVEGPEYESSEIRKTKEKEYITKIPENKRYNESNCSGKNNGFYGKTHTADFRQSLSIARAGLPNTQLGRPISIPPYRTRKGQEYPGGIFLSLAEASAVTGMARRDIRKRLDDPTLTEWRELTEQERNNLLVQRQQQ